MVFPKPAFAPRYSDSARKENSWVIFRSILIDLCQKRSYLASFGQKNIFCPLILLGQNGIFRQCLFGLSPFASAGPFGRVPKCLSAEKSIMENKSGFVSIITFDAEVGWEFK
jgi:hypothetical protein